MALRLWALRTFSVAPFARAWFALAFGAALVCSSAAASTISYVGDLRSDATFLPPDPDPGDAEFAQWAAVVKTFHLSTLSSVTATTFGYGGGTNGNGASIAAGGFEPYLSLFDAAGNFLASTFSGVTCPPGAGSYNGACYDVTLDAGTLAAGDYQIAISAFENMSLAENSGGVLLDGFTGLGNLASGEDLHYAFDVDIASTTPVPESTTLIPMAISIATACAARFGRKENRR